MLIICSNYALAVNLIHGLMETAKSLLLKLDRRSLINGIIVETVLVLTELLQITSKKSWRRVSRCYYILLSAVDYTRELVQQVHVSYINLKSHIVQVDLHT